MYRYDIQDGDAMYQVWITLCCYVGGGCCGRKRGCTCLSSPFLNIVTHVPLSLLILCLALSLMCDSSMCVRKTCKQAANARSSAFQEKGAYSARLAKLVRRRRHEARCCHLEITGCRTHHLLEEAVEVEMHQFASIFLTMRLRHHRSRSKRPRSPPD